jgi:N-acetylglucosamine kinase-like BadF-type ATPase
MIAIDLGQSGARASIDGEIFELPRGKQSGESVISAISALAELLPGASSETVALSLTGLFGVVSDPAPFHRLTHTLWGASATVVIDDGLASFFGAVGGSDGVALTLGGGVVAVGGRSGEFSHADGLGSIFGDEGSGYWLGVRGITRALATIDGRDSEVELAELLANEINGFEALAVKNSSEAVVLAIGAAAKVLAAADLGNQCAIDIRNEGARRLAATVVAAWKKAGGDFSQAPVIAISGGLSKNEGYVQQIISGVLGVIPNALHRAPQGNNLDGALWIANNISKDIEPLMMWARG